jgi:hypothetical protein
MGSARTAGRRGPTSRLGGEQVELGPPVDISVDPVVAGQLALGIVAEPSARTLVEPRPGIVLIPDWLAGERTNDSLEAVCIAPPASPIVGSTLLLTEGVVTGDGAHAAYLLGKNDKGPLTYRSGSGTNPTDCAFLPNGDLLVLERGISLINFAAKLMRVPAANVKPNSQMVGEILYEGVGGSLDNMEGLAVHPGPDGQTRITLISDDNFNEWERNLLLEFTLPG